MFYTIIIQPSTQTIFSFANSTQATEKFHTELAYAMNQGFNCTCMVIDNHGAVYKSEEYIAEE